MDGDGSVKRTWRHNVVAPEFLARDAAEVKQHLQQQLTC